MDGYVGKLLEVDLAPAHCARSRWSRSWRGHYIGGSGLAARLYLDRLGGPPYPGPLDAEAPLIVMTGPVAGHLLPGSSRFAVCGRSPLTGFWGEASCGGFFAPALKAAGYRRPDHHRRGGRARLPAGGERPGRAARRGRPVGQRHLRDRRRPESAPRRAARTLSIGPAGENLVRYAAAVHDKGHAAGRTGMGAVMGSKRLKAIVASGRGKPSRGRARARSSRCARPSWPSSRTTSPRRPSRPTAPTARCTWDR